MAEFYDELFDVDIPNDIDKLDLNNPESIIKWINENAKRVK